MIRKSGGLGSLILKFGGAQEPSAPPPPPPISPPLILARKEHFPVPVRVYTHLCLEYFAWDKYVHTPACKLLISYAQYTTAKTCFKIELKIYKWQEDKQISFVHLTESRRHFVTCVSHYFVHSVCFYAGMHRLIISLYLCTPVINP